MLAEWREVIGAVAATLTTAAFFPQVLHILHHKDARAISLPMYAVFAVGIILWLIYGLLLGSYPIIVANCVTILLVMVILYLKLKHG